MASGSVKRRMHTLFQASSCQAGRGTDDYTRLQALEILPNAVQSNSTWSSLLSVLRYSATPTPLVLRVAPRTPVTSSLTSDRQTCERGTPHHQASSSPRKKEKNGLTSQPQQSHNPLSIPKPPVSLPHHSFEWSPRIFLHHDNPSRTQPRGFPQRLHNSPCPPS